MNAGLLPNFGYTDWRLPNREELCSMIDFSQSVPALPLGHPFTNVQATYFFWSSTTVAYSSSSAWVLYLGKGLLYGSGKSFICYVWPIREGQIEVLGNADISLTKADSPDPVMVENNLTYTLTVINNGPDTATGVTISDTLPTSVTFVSATSSQGTYSRSGNIVTCNIGGLSNGDSATVTIIVTPTTTGTINNTASVTCNETDSNSANNTATATTTVNPQPTECTTWADVVKKYQDYVNCQGTGEKGRVLQYYID
jgi:uncharacterized repeat protein (TIGR01451 family)